MKLPVSQLHFSFKTRVLSDWTDDQFCFQCVPICSGPSACHEVPFEPRYLVELEYATSEGHMQEEPENKDIIQGKRTWQM